MIYASSDYFKSTSKISKVSDIVMKSILSYCTGASCVNFHIEIHPGDTSKDTF